MYKCIGCDNLVSWDGKSTFCYTCGCGATIFYNEEDKHVALPASLIIGMSGGQTLPHLGDLVGESSHTSPIKEKLIAELREKGFVWMHECEQCKKDGTLKRKQERDTHFILMEAERIIHTGKNKP